MEQILLHLLGDYVTQSDWMAQNKTKSTWAALCHATVYALPFALLGGARDEIARRLLDWIRRHAIARFTVAQAFDCLRRGMGDGATRQDLDRPLAILESRRYIRPESAPEGRRAGRPETPAYLVNPATHEAQP